MFLSYSPLTLIDFFFILFSKKMEKQNDQRATDADNYHYFAWDKGGGISGIAGLGTVCQTTRSPRTAITEWVGSSTSSSEKSQCVLVSNKNL